MITYNDEMLRRLTRQVLMARFSLIHTYRTVDELVARVEQCEGTAAQPGEDHHPGACAWKIACEYVDLTMRALKFNGIELFQHQTVDFPRVVTDFGWVSLTPDYNNPLPVGWLRFVVTFEVVCGYCGETVGVVQRHRSNPQPKGPQPQELYDMGCRVQCHLVDCPKYVYAETPIGVVKLVGFA